MMNYDFLLNPVFITIMVVYFLVMISRAVYLLSVDEFPDIFQFIFWQPFELMISIFGMGLGIVFGIPFMVISFILLCIVIPVGIWWGVIAMFQVGAFVAEFF